MIIGPPLVGKTILIRNMFFEKINEGFGGIFITTRSPAEEIADWLSSQGVDDFKIIDCVSKTTMQDLPDEPKIKRLSVMDLTGITVKVNELFKEYLKDEKKVVVAFDSLSTLLMYLNEQTVLRFLHVFSSRIRTTGAVAFYIVEEGMHDEKTIAALKQLFNGVLELKDENNQRFLRYMDTSVRIDWKEFEVQDNAIVVKT
jgi:KaiC/GvpD/RAD55 family RecA-like ATPase